LPSPPRMARRVSRSQPRPTRARDDAALH
jgi:hypothetical protein